MDERLRRQILVKQRDCDYNDFTTLLDGLTAFYHSKMHIKLLSQHG